WYAPRHVKESQHFPMLAPVVRLSSKVHVEAGLLPVTDGCKNIALWFVAFPQIQQSGLPGLRLQAGKGRDGTFGRTKILSVADESVVLFDSMPDYGITVGETNFVVNRVRPEKNEIANPKFFASSNAGRTRHVDHGVGI